jgi:hypothetical protein
MPDQAFLTLFLVGLLGGTHCAGMCGGIVGALALQLPGDRPVFGIHLAYNFGRIASYALAGALAGAVGQAFGVLLPVRRSARHALGLAALRLGL